CGFLAPRSSLPAGWRWLNTISFETYVIKGLAVNEMYNIKWSCHPWERLVSEVDSCQLVDGHDALNLYDMDVDHEHYKWTLLLYEFCFWVIFNALAYMALSFLDWSNTDTSEVPNWTQQEIKRKQPVVIDNHADQPAAVAGGVAVQVDL